MPWYRVSFDWTYSSTASARDALDAVNATLAAQGCAERATRVGKRVSVTIEPAPEALHDTLSADWATGTRTAGSASMERRDESA